MRTTPYIHAPLWLLLVGISGGNICAQVGQVPPPTSQQQNAATGRVSGRIISTLGGPVPKATIRLIYQSTQTSPQNVGPVSFLEIAGSDGSFTFENLPEGRYTITAQKPGFGADPNLPNSSNQITLAAAENKRSVEVKLSPLAAISGRILDRDGDPVSNVQVRLMRYGSQQGRTVLQQQNSGNSDDRGQYRIPNINPGRYYVVAEDPTSRFGGGQQEIRGASAQSSNLTTYYPSAGEIRNATRLEVKAGMQFDGMDIRLNRGQVFAVRGVVTDDTGAPIQAQIIFHDKTGMTMPLIGLQSSSAPTTGVFSLPAVPSGDYLVTVRSTVVVRPPPAPANGAARPAVAVGVVIPNSPVLFGRFDLSVRGGNIDGLRMQLVPGPTITGRVILEGGGEFSQSAVTIVNGTSTQVKRPSTITLIEMDGTGGGSGGQVQSDGAFTIANVTPSRYVINTNGLPPQTYVKSIRMSGQDVTNQLLDFRSGVAAPLEILMANKPAKVSGSAQNSKGEPAVNASVLLWPKTPRLSDPTGGIRTTRSNAAGGFTLANVPPGEYYSAVFEDATQEYLRIPDFLARFSASAKTIKLSEDGNETVEPKWIGREASDKEATSFPD